jgi:hypothetical protein
MRKLYVAKKLLWEVARSPKTIAILKLGAALVGVVHAIEELRDVPTKARKPMGFTVEED